VSNAIAEANVSQNDDKTIAISLYAFIEQFDNAISKKAAPDESAPEEQGNSSLIYSVLEMLPLFSIIAGVATLLVASFFVTSSDSGSYVVDTLTSGGRHNAPKFQKIFWASME